MSNALAIASVTAVIKKLLEDSIADNNFDAPLGGGVVVKTEAPSENGSPANRLNLFMYHVSENAALRNSAYPAYNSAGSRVANAPLALDLHYLITAYGSDDLHPELLLGAGMQALYEKPILDNKLINSILQTISVGALQLQDSGLAEQLEKIRILPHNMGGEELSRLWAAFQAPYRPSAAYKASVVLIEAEESIRSALPVLMRGAEDSGATVIPDLTPPIPALTELVPPQEQTSVLLTDTLTLNGHDLQGSGHTITFRHNRIDDPVDTLAPDSIDDNALTVTIPNSPTTWPAGFYQVTASLQLDGETFTRTTNALPLALSPSVTSITPTRINPDRVDIAIEVSPEVLPEQNVSLLVGSEEIQANPIVSQTKDLTFENFSLASGDYIYRLRVDGVESIFIDRTKEPPEFIPTQVVSIP